MSVLAFLIAVAFWPGLVDPAMAPKWAVIAVGASFLLLGRKVDAYVVGLAAIAVVIAAASLMWAPSVINGVDELVHLMILAVVFCLGASVDDLTPVWKGLAVGVLASSGVAVAQLMGWSGVAQEVPVAGLYMNKNLFAEAGMVALVAMLSQRMWFLAIGPFAAVVIGGSRAVWLALATAAVCVLWGRDRKAAVAVSLMVAGLLALFVYGGSYSVSERLAFWRETLSGATLFGHGLGSFATTYPHAEFAHNEYAQMVYEYGVMAAWFMTPMIAIIILASPDHETERIVLLAVCVVAMFSFPFHMPVTGFAAALAAGHIAGARSGVRGDVNAGPLQDELHFWWFREASTGITAGGGRGIDDLCSRSSLTKYQR